MTGEIVVVECKQCGAPFEAIQKGKSKIATLCSPHCAQSIRDKAQADKRTALKALLASANKKE